MCGCEDKIWRGIVIDYYHEWTTSMGIRTYKVFFNGNKEAYFEISSKRQFPIIRGEMLFFSGCWMGPEDGRKYYMIRKVYSNEEMMWLYEVEKKKKNMIMS